MELKGGQPLKHLLFGDNLFVIPDFQRDFAWGRRQVSELIGDISSRMGARADGTDATCYLGTIVLLDAGDGQDTASLKPFTGSFLKPGKPLPARKVAIVDGQQRLITLTILLAVLRDRLDAFGDPLAGDLHSMIAQPVTANGTSSRRGDPNGTDAYLLDLGDRPESECFRRFVQERGGTLCGVETGDGEADLPTRTLLAARNQVLDRFALAKAGEARAWGRMLREQCSFSVTLTSDDTSGWEIFTRINKRGLPLLESERLKSEILVGCPFQTREHWLALWDRRKRQLGRAFDAGEKKQKDLFSYIREYAGGGPGRTEDRILDLASALGPDRFMSEVFEPVSKALLQLETASFLDPSGAVGETDATFEHHLVALDLLGRVFSSDRIERQDAWKMPLIHFMAARPAPSPEAVKSFTSCYERYLHLLVILHGKKNKQQITRHLSTLATLIGRQGAELDTASAFRIANTNQVMSNLRGSIDGAIAKLVLLRAACQNGEIALGDCHGFLGRDYNIEHILPEKTTDAWKKMAGGGMAARKLRSSIGNLIIISRQLNSRIGNKSWAEKRLALRHTSQALPLATYVLDAVNWDEAAIRSRESAILDLLDDLWDLPEAIGWSKPDRKQAAQKATAKTTARQPAGASKRSAKGTPHKSEKQPEKRKPRPKAARSNKVVYPPRIRAKRNPPRDNAGRGLPPPPPKARPKPGSHDPKSN